ncbi:Regulator of RNase E activity RraA [Dethiosulfatibacter aminovorans DSM 17477]|uniref:Putative 4-hydroxy-4-methyl-2-oxoglutarate aldolase n=1 Tax=Dethiosulfatibacter aminovorans DSM 17477 TaxID=1121476 RepID=A0A1M6DS61_9FIRM|nr:RraA family protein [Dethiosulfatibacter aminovorans]SHI75960.1 Regulator of RNase E activity RraA [Dethiosulfatibacter aminovorans DSM 17477]
MKILPRVNNLSKDIIERYKNAEPATAGHYIHTGFMNPAIKPVFPNVKVVGPAFTLKITVNDSTLLHYCIDLIQPGDVIVIDRIGDDVYAPVGDVLALAAKERGAAAIIVDGPVTDIHGIKDVGIPVFATGVSVVTTKLLGLYGEINTSIQCGGAVVNPGDLIFGDDTGVLVIKCEDADELLEKVEKDMKFEKELIKKIKNGMSLPEISGATNLVKSIML